MSSLDSAGGSSGTTVPFGYLLTTVPLGYRPYTTNGISVGGVVERADTLRTKVLLGRRA